MKRIGPFVRSLGIFVLAVLIGPIALADDVDDVLEVIREYNATETDLDRQARLMTDDRTFIAGGVRQTNNVVNMQNQMAAAARNAELDPDVRVTVSIEDPIVRVYGDAAVASFYRFWNVISSAESVRAGRNASGPPDSVVTMVLAKMGNDWKIVHTHQSNRSPQ